MIDQTDLVLASINIEDRQDTLETIYGHTKIALELGDKDSMKKTLEFIQSQASEFIISCEDSNIDLDYIKKRFEKGEVAGYE